MQFLVEHQTTGRALVTLCDTLSDIEVIASDVVGDELELGPGYEGELTGEWGVLRYAPAG